MLANGSPDGLAIGTPVELAGPAEISPDDSWIGRIIDPNGRPLDGKPLFRGPVARPLRTEAPPAAQRRALGERLSTGVAVFDTLLPLVRGQRIGLFAGSGVGKSSLLAKFARGVAADIVVIALVGERGRELREFTERVLGPAGMARSVVVAATSDQPALTRRRCAYTAMAVAEHFRDQGLHVLFLADSITRFAEAHREVALAAGESSALRGFPPSLNQAIMGLADRGLVAPGMFADVALSTGGGLIFTGFTDGTFAAFDDTTLEQVWKINVGTGFNAPPMTFEVDGKQYVAILSGLSPISKRRHSHTPELREMRNQTMLFVFGL